MSNYIMQRKDGQWQNLNLYYVVEKVNFDNKIIKKEVWLQSSVHILIVLPNQWNQIWHKIYVRKLRIKLSETSLIKEEVIVVLEYSNSIHYW